MSEKRMQDFTRVRSVGTRFICSESPRPMVGNFSHLLLSLLSLFLCVYVCVCCSLLVKNPVWTAWLLILSHPMHWLTPASTRSYPYDLSCPHVHSIQSIRWDRVLKKRLECYFFLYQQYPCNSCCLHATWERERERKRERKRKERERERERKGRRKKVRSLEPSILVYCGSFWLGYKS